MRSTRRNQAIRFRHGLWLLALLGPAAAGQDGGAAGPVSSPLTLVENRGPWDSQVLFLARTARTAIIT